MCLKRCAFSVEIVTFAINPEVRMEAILKKMIGDLRKQVVEKEPEKGLFDVVYEEYKNTDKIYLDSTVVRVSIPYSTG